jgi:hypothetical protein
LNLLHLPGRANARPVRIAEILHLHVQGLTLPEIGGKLDRGPARIWQIIRRTGLQRGLYSFGDLLDVAATRNLKKISGLSAEEFAQHVHVAASPRRVDDYLRKKQQHFEPKRSKEISDGRRNLIVKLMSTEQKEYPRGRVLKTFFPDLAKKSRFLCEVLQECRFFLQSKPTAELAQLEDYLCDQGDRELLDARGPRIRKLFRRFLPWMPDIVPCLDFNLARGKGPIWDSACQSIAKYWGTTPGIIREAIDPHTRPLPPDRMRWLILHAASPSAFEKQSPVPGGPF